jgi:hypothetical protein
VDGDVHLATSGCEHVDESIDAEELDFASDEIADSWLRYSEEFGSLSLSKALFSDDGAKIAHEDRSDPKVFGFLFREAQVLEHVPGGGDDLLGH